MATACLINVSPTNLTSEECSLMTEDKSSSLRISLFPAISRQGGNSVRISFFRREREKFRISGADKRADKMKETLERA